LRADHISKGQARGRRDQPVGGVRVRLLATHAVSQLLCYLPGEFGRDQFGNTSGDERPISDIERSSSETGSHHRRHFVDIGMLAHR